MLEVISVSRETKDRLDILAALVTEWNATINLVADDGVANLWDRHIVDSLQLAPFLGGVSHAADLGTGAGFPGLVLAISTEVRFTLLESDRRKAAFLREAIRVTQATAEVCAMRVESWSGNPFEVVTARAFAPLKKLIGMSRHLLRPGGRYLLLKGVSAPAEVAAARELYDFTIDFHPVGQHGGNVLELRLAEGERG